MTTSKGRLTGRTALVTGASRGIGLAIAERFAAEGATVAVTARTVVPASNPMEGSLTETVEKITDAGGQSVAIPADLSRPEERERLIRLTEATLGPVDILVNNAAVSWYMPVASFTPKRRELMFQVQVYAPMDLTQHVLPSMVAAGEGWILNISSAASRHPPVPPGDRWRGGGAVYGMCKAALERFTTGLAAEAWESNVAVNSLSPMRVVPTPGTRFHKLVRPDDPRQVVEDPAVMAQAALELCCRPPRSLTGRIAYSQALLDELRAGNADAGVSERRALGLPNEPSAERR
jgi:NAD(P)-dependent dehydrogenase (short-subunit alcohol dehydrogenase family)